MRRKRDLTFVDVTKQLPAALGIPAERLEMIDREVCAMNDTNTPLHEIITAMNEKGLTDAEWTSFVFALGYFAGSIGWGR